MKRIRRIIRPMLCMVVLLVAMTTGVMGCYQKDPDPIEVPSDTSEVEATPIPTVNRQAELADAKSRNPDAVAWLYIPGAEVDDPVMQAEDNGFYLNRDELRRVQPHGAATTPTAGNHLSGQGCAGYQHRHLRPLCQRLRPGRCAVYQAATAIWTQTS